MRADARDNRARLLRAARDVFAAQGAQASLNKVAQRAGVGPGTLYRHFPSLSALLVAVIGDDVAALCARGRALRHSADARAALEEWLFAVADHAAAMGALVAVRLAAPLDNGEGAELAACHGLILEVGTELLDEAREAGAVADEVDIADVLKLANAAAWASEQGTGDPALRHRLMTVVVRGLRPGSAASSYTPHSDGHTPPQDITQAPE